MEHSELFGVHLGEFLDVILARFLVLAAQLGVPHVLFNDACSLEILLSGFQSRPGCLFNGSEIEVLQQNLGADRTVSHEGRNFFAFQFELSLFAGDASYDSDVRSEEGHPSDHTPIHEATEVEAGDEDG